MSDYDLLKDDVYSLRKEGDGLRVTKFTKDLNPVAFYHLKPDGHDGFTCNCPQSNRGHCKHLDINDMFEIYPERVDKGWFFCHQTGDWFPPVSAGESSAVAPAEAVPEPSKAGAAVPEVVGTPSPPSGTFSRRGL